MRWGRGFRLATRVLLDEGLVAYVLVLSLVSAALLVGRGLYVLMRPESAKSEALTGLLQAESELTQRLLAFTRRPAWLSVEGIESGRGF